MITVNPHAYKRAIQRFAVMPKEANRWINERLEESTYLDTQDDGRLRFIHPTEPIIIVTSAEKDLIITVMEVSTEKVSVKTEFLDGMIAVLEREYDKMKLTYRRKARNMEAQIAQSVKERGETLIKRARVYNPETQSILQKQADDIAARIDELEEQYKEMQREYEISSLKVRGFLRTASGERR